MKKLLSLVLVALMVLPFGMLSATTITADEGTVLYVKEGGTGDGSSADNALPSIFAANEIAASKTEDVTIKFVGTVTIDGTDTEKFVGTYYEEPAHANKITWTGADADSKIVIVTAKNTSDTKAKYYCMGGELKIENIDIEISGHKVFVIITHLHDIEVGEGVTVTNPSTAAETISIYGAVSSTYNKSPYYDAETATHTVNPTITIKSGSFKQVVAYIGNASTNLTAAKTPFGKTVVLNGDVTFNVSGANTYIYQIYPVCNSYNTVTNCTINLDGGIIGRFVGATDRKYTKGIVSYGPSGTVGTYTLYITENFDLNAQTALIGNDGNSKQEFMLALCGATANKDFAGAIDDPMLGTYILKLDAAIYDAAIAETNKINFATFDDVQKVEKTVEPEDTTPVEPEDTTPVEPEDTTPVETEPAETEPTETEPAATEPAETEPAETEPAETEPSEETEQPGNVPTGDASMLTVVVTAIAVASLGVVIILKKRENA